MFAPQGCERVQLKAMSSLSEASRQWIRGFNAEYDGFFIRLWPERNSFDQPPVHSHASEAIDVASICGDPALGAVDCCLALAPPTLQAAFR